jgi:hypothetical protein
MATISDQDIKNDSILYMVFRKSGGKCGAIDASISIKNMLRGTALLHQKQHS